MLNLNEYDDLVSLAVNERIDIAELPKNEEPIERVLAACKALRFKNFNVAERNFLNNFY